MVPSGDIFIASQLAGGGDSLTGHLMGRARYIYISALRTTKHDPMLNNKKMSQKKKMVPNVKFPEMEKPYCRGRGRNMESTIKILDL